MPNFIVPVDPKFDVSNVPQIKESDYITADFVNNYYQIFLNNMMAAWNEAIEKVTPEQLKAVSDKFGNIDYMISDKIDEIVSNLGLKADLESPNFTGNPRVPTAAPGTSTTQAASTAFVAAMVGALSSLMTTEKGSIVGAVNDIISRILDDKESITANTTENMIAGALPVKELYKNMGGLIFAQDENGKWGYKVGGADSVHPFNYGFGPIQHKHMYPTSTQNGVGSNINMAVYNTEIKGKELYKTFFYIAMQGSQNGVASGSICSPNLDGVPEQYNDTYDPETGILRLYGYGNTANGIHVLWM